MHQLFFILLRFQFHILKYQQMQSLISFYILLSCVFLLCLTLKIHYRNNFELFLQHHFPKSLEELETSVPSLFCQKQERKTNDRIDSNYSSHLSLSFQQSAPPWMKIYMFFLILSFCFPLPN